MAAVGEDVTIARIASSWAVACPPPLFHRGPAERTVAEPAREGGEAGPAPAGMEEVEVVVLAAPAAETGAALELQHGGDGRGSEWLALVGPGGREVARRAVPPGSGVLRARWRRGRREVRVTLGPPGGAEGDDGRDGVGGGPAEGEGNPAGTAAVALREVSNEKGRSLAVAEDAPAGSLLLEEEPVSTRARPPTHLAQRGP